MTFNGIGVVTAIATFLSVWLGHVSVRKIEYHTPRLWVPMLIALSLFVEAIWGSALLGVFGASIVWGATELRDQAVRAELGWYRFNPNPKLQPPLAKWIRKIKPPHL